MGDDGTHEEAHHDGFFIRGQVLVMGGSFLACRFMLMFLPLSLLHAPLLCEVGRRLSSPPFSTVNLASALLSRPRSTS